MQPLVFVAIFFLNSSFFCFVLGIKGPDSWMLMSLFV